MNFSLKSLFVLTAVCAMGLTLAQSQDWWVRAYHAVRAPQEAFVAHPPAMMVDGGVRVDSQLLTERQWQMFNYVHDGDVVEFDKRVSVLGQWFYLGSDGLYAVKSRPRSTVRAEE